MQLDSKHWQLLECHKQLSSSLWSHPLLSANKTHNFNLSIISADESYWQLICCTDSVSTPYPWMRFKPIVSIDCCCNYFVGHSFICVLWFGTEVHSVPGKRWDKGLIAYKYTNNDCEDNTFDGVDRKVMMMTMMISWLWWWYSQLTKVKSTKTNCTFASHGVLHSGKHRHPALSTRYDPTANPHKMHSVESK